MTAAENAASHPGEAINELVLSGVVGYGLSWAQRRAGVIGLGAEVVSLALACSSVRGMLNQPQWLGQVKNLWTDTWNNKAHLEGNQTKAASLLGKATFDVAVMTVGGGLGGGLGRSEFPRKLPYARNSVSLPTTNLIGSWLSEVKTYGPKSEIAALYEERARSVVAFELPPGKPAGVATTYASGLIVHKSDLGCDQLSRSGVFGTNGLED